MKTRRDFLRLGGKTVAAGSALGLLGKFSGVNAYAAGNGYQALVCVYLAGGNDGHNMIIPFATSQQSYATYAASRQSLAIPPGSLLQVQAKNGDVYGFNPNMPELRNLFLSGQAAVMANVGMLVNPIINKQAYNAYPAGSPQVPVNLFSHSDQSSQWQTAQPNGIAASGWGGRLADSLQSINSGAQFPPVVNNGGCGPFCTGVQTLPGVFLRKGRRGSTEQTGTWRGRQACSNC